MNILRFVNSEDIRNHLENIGYSFSSLEAAWLIYQCRNAAVEEKHEAWKELIRTMPDCKIEERPNTEPQESLHEFLKQHMKLENRYIDQFFCDDSDGRSVYTIKYIDTSDREYESDMVFSCFDTVRETIQGELDVRLFQCTKKRLDESERNWPAAVFNADVELLDFHPGWIKNYEEHCIYYGVFDGLWFDFPTPFKKGDIVWVPTRPYIGRAYGGPFAITGVCLERIESEKRKERIRAIGDTSDMCVSGYFLNEDGSLYEEVTENYMDLEFYKKELNGPHRTLTAISNYLKGKADVLLFAQAYHQLITDGYANGK